MVIHVAVIDTGPGIPEGRQALIFDAFTQADGSTSRRYGGTGLGLTISNQLVRLMDGRMWVESTMGVGSVFHFTARVGKVIARTTDPRALPDVAGLRVLVVDRDPMSRRVLVDSLDRLGIEVVATASTDDAISAASAAFASYPIDLAVVESDLFSEHGGALPRALNTGARPVPCVVVVPAIAPAGDLAILERGGAAACLRRPTDLADLARTIHELARSTGAMENVQGVLGDAVTNVDRAGIEASPARAAVEFGGADPAPPRVGGTPAQSDRARVRVDQASVPAGDAAIAHSGSRTRRVSVLLAEDNDINQKLAVRLLEKRGYAVEVAGNGREAVEMWANGAFDIILMDVMMPEMSGLEAARAIRAHEGGGRTRTPIVALTANAMKGDREACLEAGMDAYVSKPIEADTLLGEMASLAPSPDTPIVEATPEPESLRDDVIDRVGLFERVEGDLELLADMITMFDTVRGDLTAQIVDALAREDLEVLTRAAHTMKGNLANLGAVRAFDAAKRFEATCRDANLDVARAELPSLEAEVQRFHEALNSLGQSEAA